MRLFSRELSMTNALPLVRRELRAESRRPINYGLRVLTAAVVVVVFAGFTATTQLAVSRLGAALFAVLRQSLLLAMWVIVPMMTADCISREKREGTLGLLFLTPMTVLDVMMGKAATHVLRAATLLVASVPVLVLPFVLGGVVWQQVVLAVAARAGFGYQPLPVQGFQPFARLSRTDVGQRGSGAALDSGTWMQAQKIEEPLLGRVQVTEGHVERGGDRLVFRFDGE